MRERGREGGGGGGFQWLWFEYNMYKAMDLVHNQHCTVFCTVKHTHTHLPVAVIDHDVVWFDISMHDAHTVAVVQRSQQLVEIVANVVVCQLLVESLCSVCVCVCVCVCEREREREKEGGGERKLNGVHLCRHSYK